MKGDARERSIHQAQSKGRVPAVDAADEAGAGHAQERMADGQRDSTVYGERGATSVSRSHSIQSRVSSLLAAALMMVVGVGMLAWYYTNAFEKQSRLREGERAATASRAQAEMSLPPFGRIDAPPMTSGTTTQAGGSCVTTADELPEPPLAPSSATVMLASPGLPPVAYGSSIEKGPAQLALERRLSGVVFVRWPQSRATLDDGLTGAAATLSTAAIGGGVPGDSVGGNPLGAVPMDGSRDVVASGDGRTPVATGSSATELAVLLRPRVTAAVGAQILPTQRLLLAKGAFIDCTLETAIDSTLPGMATCITATDTFGVDGKVVLLERGTKLVGETRGQVQQGAARVFVLWSEARTPTGVVVPLSSPAADELGRAGLPGKVNRHFLDRFGAAILISVIDGAVQSAVQSSRTSGAVIYDPAASRDVLTEVLRSSVNIGPTVVKQHGERIQVLVARDLDFRSVYELRTAIPSANTER